MDRYLPIGIQSPCKFVFRGLVDETTALALEVCQEGNSTTGRTASDDWKAFIHDNTRVVLRKGTYNTLHNTNVFGANAPTPPVDTQVSIICDLFTTMSAGNNGNDNNNNNNNITVSSTPP